VINVSVVFLSDLRMKLTDKTQEKCLCYLGIQERCFLKKAGSEGKILISNGTRFISEIKKKKN
jgi:hypothetical protein